MDKKIKLAVLSFLAFSLLFVFNFVFAQERALEVEYPKITEIEPEAVAVGLPEYVKYVFNLGIITAGLVLLGALFYGGFLYLISAGRPDKLKEARERISSAFLGVAILLSGYVILSIINPQLVILRLPFLPQIITPPFVPQEPPEPDQITLISRELPKGQAIDGEKGIWAEARTNQTKELFEEFESFLKEESEVNPTINRISDLNKYLQTLTEECSCGNTTPWCTKPADWALPIGCSGDPCLPETREKMERTFEVNGEKVEELLEFQQGIRQEKEGLETTLNKFSEIEQEAAACQYQGKSIYSLFEYLNLKQFYDETGDRAVALPHYFESRGDPLTFYCSVGGNAFDIPYTRNLPLEGFDVEDFGLSEFDSGSLPQSISCPIELPLGSVTDRFRELKILLLAKMERTNILIEEMVTEIRNMANLVSQCNEENCQAQCSCIPNPCYQACATIICAPWCESRCLQAVGGCSGEACPREEIKETPEKIKKIEDEIFSTLAEIKEIFPEVDFALKDPENPINLQNLRTSVQLCSGPVDQETLTTDWQLVNCQNAVGNFGPDGSIIAACQPRNFFCCTPTRAAEPNFPAAVRDRPTTIIPPKTYPELPSVNNCPKGWICDQSVAFYNQYNDASKPVKQLLSCMRERLDAVQKEKEIEETLGRIANITDPKLYEGTCDWGAGPLQEGGCSFPYTVKEGKANVSAHYGGPFCSWQRASYALDIGVSSSLEKKYADEIIEAAKECSPSAYLQYLTPGFYDHIHISLAGANQCGVD